MAGIFVTSPAIKEKATKSTPIISPAKTSVASFASEKEALEPALADQTDAVMATIATKAINALKFCPTITFT
ncbi:hypothetical protein COU37_02065 [Candidatus Micrarchaeota archaeon CG10_big_fil_rev_8_21_14_0_10_45_29]|nr:MAG: hypothetical protein COU37_02065 [Candidatus Micrarchaeota archaeon CG10_big_fil_rev_8_21_14_0_10_45_29]